MKEHPTGLLSNEQKILTYTYAYYARNVIHVVHEFGTIVNNRNINQVKE